MSVFVKRKVKAVAEYQKLLVFGFLVAAGWMIFLSSLGSGDAIPPSAPSTAAVLLEPGRSGALRRAMQLKYEELHSRQELQKLSASMGGSSALSGAAARFVLVTGERATACKSSGGSHLLMKSFKNKVDYCNLRGCKVWYTLETWDEDFPGTWVRYPLLKRLMQANAGVKWFMWMDADAIFTDMNFSIPLDEYDLWNKHLIVPGYADKVYGGSPDWVGLNAGVFLIRNSEWSLDFLDKWMEMKSGDGLRYKAAVNKDIPNRPQEWKVEDQSALVYLLRRLPVEERDAKTYLEVRYALHGYWDMIVDKLEKLSEQGRRGEEAWPFVTHFCGCQFCSGFDPKSRCALSFERAYHFADNQIIGLAGMKHLNLGASSVKSITAGLR